MSAFEDGFYVYLQTKSSITNLVGTRIYPLRMPQRSASSDTVYPCITYQRISSRPVKHMTAAAPLQEARLQVDCWAATYASADALADALRLALDGYRGLWGSDVIRCCHLENTMALHEEPWGGDEQGVFRMSQDYLIWHVVSVPSF